MLALSRTKDNNLQLNIIIGLLLGFLAAGAASPLTGGLVAVYFLWDSWKKAGEIQRNQSAIALAGCVAQVLDGDDFADYTYQLGEDAVLEELQFAVKRGLSLSAAAEDFLEEKTSPQSSMPNPQSPLLNKAKGLLENAGLVVSVESEEEIYTNPHEQIDIIGSMTERVSNSLILGIAGAGKGVIISNALRVAKSKHQKLRIFYIDPKDDEREYGYTVGIADVIKRFKCETQVPETVTEWLEEIFGEFNKYAKENKAKGERTLLVLDEGTVLGLKCKIAKSSILIDRLSSLTSLGDSSGKNVWFVAQTPFVGGSGIDLSASSQLVTIAVISQENRGSLGQWKRSAVLAKVKNLDDLINNSEVKRALYFGKTDRWYPMPKLANYSGYDRDNHQVLDGSARETELETSEDIEAIKNQLEATFNKQQSDVLLPEIATKVLAYFDAVKNKSPKSLRDMKKADRLAAYSNEELTAALQELCNAGILIYDGVDTWVKADW